MLITCTRDFHLIVAQRGPVGLYKNKGSLTKNKTTKPPATITKAQQLFGFRKYTASSWGALQGAQMRSRFGLPFEGAEKATKQSIGAFCREEGHVCHKCRDARTARTNVRHDDDDYVRNAEGNSWVIAGLIHWKGLC